MTRSERIKVRSGLSKAKKCLNPARDALADNVHLCQDASRSSLVVLDEIQKCPEMHKFMSAFGQMERVLSDAMAKDRGSGRSNRSRFAKPVNRLFTDAALNHTQLGPKDAYNNPIDEENDLGRNGQFSGLKIVVYQQYSDFPFAPVKQHWKAKDSRND